MSKSTKKSKKESVEDIINIESDKEESEEESEPDSGETEGESGESGEEESGDSDEEESDEEESDEEPMEKKGKVINKKDTSVTHGFLTVEEVASKVLQQNTTLSSASKFEKSKILCIRVSQLEDGLSPMFDLEGFKYANDVQKIAEEEIRRKICPLSIIRKLPNGKVEVIPVSELTW